MDKKRTRKVSPPELQTTNTGLRLNDIKDNRSSQPIAQSFGIGEVWCRSTTTASRKHRSQGGRRWTYCPRAEEILSKGMITYKLRRLVNVACASYDRLVDATSHLPAQCLQNSASGQRSCRCVLIVVHESCLCRYLLVSLIQSLPREGSDGCFRTGWGYSEIR